MLKACWDCLAGNGVLRNSGENEGSYGVQLNGDSETAPLRPVRQAGRNMLALPRPFNSGDRVVVSGIFSNQDRFMVNLLTGSPIPDYNNIACQLEANFPTGNNTSNGFTLRIIEGGQNRVVNGSYQDNLASDMISDSSVQLAFQFEIANGMSVLTVHVNDSYLEQFQLRHKIGDVTFLGLSENFRVTELAFGFA